jgi:hypothetical protein
MEGLRWHFDGKFLPEPALDGQVTGDPAGGRQTRLELGEDRGRQALLPRGRPRLLIGYKRFEAPKPILAEPARDGMARHGEMGRRWATRRDLPGFEADEERPARPPWRGPLAAPACLSHIPRFNHRWEGLIHSFSGPSLEGYLGGVHT